MRFLPDIRYGTEGHPEKVARRLSTLNLATWIAATAAAGFAVAHVLDPAPGLWKLAAVEALATPIFAFVPLLHRFGPISAGLTFLIVLYAYLFAIVWLEGTGTPMQMFYLVAAGLTLLFFGRERILLSVFLSGLAVALIVVLELLVPYNTGLESPARLFVDFAAGTIVACTSLFMVVAYAL